VPEGTDIWPFVKQKGDSAHARGYSPPMGVLTLPSLPVPSPRVPRVPPMWREARYGIELAQLRRSTVFQGDGVVSGEGRAVMLIPGFLAGDGSLATMAHWLRAAGYHTRRAGMRANVACSAAACERLEARLEGFAEHTGQRVTIIGQSRGGVFARALAAKRPDLVGGIITLGSPTVSQLRVHPLVLVHVGVVSALGSGGMPGLFTWRCLRGDCCEDFRASLVAPFPADVEYRALYSRSDGIVDWRSCLDPAAEQIEVNASHCGMSVNAGVYREIASALAAYRPRDAATLPLAA
jgi:triacylglycerol lipase